MTQISSETATFVLTSKPGIKRDGTDLDNGYYQDAKWVRFQRGRPRKIGGYRQMTDIVAGPARSVFVDARATGNTAHVFSPSAIEQVAFDSQGNGAGVVTRTPASGFSANNLYTWSVDSMFDSSGGGNTVLIAAATPDIDTLASDSAGGVYSGIVSAVSAFTQISDGSGAILVSGGCCVLQPFLFVYGSNGLIRNSNANNFAVAGWTGGSANTANVAGTKIVKGLPVRGGGNSPAGLFWSLDSLIRVTFLGGTIIWKYDTVSSSISILAKNCVIEYDGVYYWIGIDRFYAYTGVVQELPNDMNLNYFFDNLNYAQRNKIWAMKVPRYGEIWWFFPSGASTECDKAIIFNVREGTWYDAELMRSAGYPAKVFERPIFAGGALRATKLAVLTSVTGGFDVNDVVTGAPSGAVGAVARSTTTSVNIVVTSGTFAAADVITCVSGSGTISGTPTDQPLDSVWQHEAGVDAIVKQNVTAIESSFETTNFQWMSGGPVSEAPNGLSLQTRITRIEPDFVLRGNLMMYVNGSSYAQAPKVLSDPYLITPTTEYVDMREQRREISVRFVSNEIGGDYQMGRNFITAEPGDARG